MSLVLDLSVVVIALGQPELLILPLDLPVFQDPVDSDPRQQHQVDQQQARQSHSPVKPWNRGFNRHFPNCLQDQIIGVCIVRVHVFDNDDILLVLIRIQVYLTGQFFIQAVGQVIAAEELVEVWNRAIMALVNFELIRP